jgi:hypothetical protein
MKEHTTDAYRVQEENKGGDHGGFERRLPGRLERRIWKRKR